MSNKPKTSLRTNQEGIVAVIVAVILMLILSLIVLAVSQNATREQRQALDRQLSEQAFYNAESGINDAANYLYAHRNDAAVPALKPDCTPLPGVNANIDGTNGINKYTCIQYNRIPKSIIYD